MKKQPEQMPEDQRFHDTYLLLKKYRDVVWGLELSVQQVKRRFQMEVGSSIEDFLESIYLAGVDFSDNGIQEQARSIEKSYQMLKLLEVSVNIMRNKHKHGEMYYWLLYYSYLSPQQYRSLRPIHYPRSVRPCGAGTASPCQLSHFSLSAIGIPQRNLGVA